MKTRKQGPIALLLALALLGGLLPAAAAAADPAPAEAADPLSAGTEETRFDVMADIARQMQDPDKDPFAFEAVPALRRVMRSTQGLPDAYDLRHVPTGVEGEEACCVTPVKNQGNFGNCWAFAAIASAETSILSSGLAAAQGMVYAITPDTPEEMLALDLSEKHLAYFFEQPVDDPDDPQYGEGYFYTGTPGDWYNYFNGGLPFYATGLFASGTGPVAEFGYVLEDDVWVQPFMYRGKNGNIYYAGGGPSCYSADDDWSIDGQWRWYQDYVLKESYLLPTPSGKTGAEKDAAIKAIKEQIKAGRAVQTGFCADGSAPGEDYETYYISPNWAHYTYDNAGANHAVVIIGWDDNYPKENFAHRIQNGYAVTPDYDGAWLVKNSWGSHEEEFPNKGYENNPWGLLQGQDRGVYNQTTGKWEYNAVEGAVNTGYFWISYEDKSMCLLEALDFDAANDEEGYYLYQYDFLPVSNVSAATEPVPVRMANVFEAGADGIIDRVSCQTTTPGTHVRYEVYLLDDDAANPMDGVMIAATEADYPYGGFHKALLDTPVLLREGQCFAVVVTQVTPGGRYCLSTQSAKKYSSGAVQNRCVVKPGESFFYVEGKGWFDLSAEENRRLLIGDRVETEYLDNFPIKAYLAIPETPEEPAEPEPPTEPEPPEAPVSPGAWDGGWYWYDGSGEPAGVNIESKPDAPEPETPEPAAFEDVGDDAWYADAVAWAVAAGITEGTDETHFSPALTCSRGEMVTFLWRAAGCPEPAEDTLHFTDTQSDSYYEKAVRWAVAAGITTGMDETHFAPDAPVSRAQTVVFLFRCFGGTAAAETAFVDVSEDAWYAAAVAWAAECGITTGVDAAHFAPELDCTRAQVVTFLYRVFSQNKS